MNGLAGLARDWLPPAVGRAARRWRGDDIRFEGGFATWNEAADRCSGYEDHSILAKVLAATLEVKRGKAAYERDSVLFQEPDPNWPVAAALLWAAARARGRLAVLDLGGALGSSYFQNRPLLQGLPSVRWCVVEQAHFAAAGRTHVQDETLRFHETIGACAAEERPNAVLLSAVLQYLEDPRRVIDELLALAPDVVIVDRTIVNDGRTDRFYIQRVPASIYSASYPCRSLSEPGLLAALEDRYGLASSYPSLEFPALRQIASRFRGYVFHKATE